MSLRPYLTHEHPLRFAHRGSRVLWPENTMTAFQGAVDLGYRYIETDIHLTRDGRVVVFHDDALDKLTNGTGKVWDLDWSELRHLDAAHHFQPDAGFPLRGTGIGMPLLEDVLRTFPEVMFNLDLKQRRMEGALADELRRFGFEERVLIGSFYDHRVRKFRKASRGRVATSSGPIAVAGGLVGSRLRPRIAGRSDALQIPERIVSKRLIDAAHRGGKQVHVWTVNDPEAMRDLLALGVDGIVTDRPDVLNEVLGL